MSHGQRKQGSFPFKSDKYEIRNRLESFPKIFSSKYDVLSIIPRCSKPFAGKT